MKQILTIGETTYDIVFKNEQPVFSIVGGSMLNTSVSLGRLGLPVSFVSRIGQDTIGELSCKFILDNGINIKFTQRFNGNSRIALAFLDETNQANYQFYKEENAPYPVYPRVNQDDLILLGSTHAIADEGRDALISFLESAKEQKAIIMYDPNIRVKTNEEMDQIRRRFEENLTYTKILKGSDEDFSRLYGPKTVLEYFNYFKSFGVELLFITAGATKNVIASESLILEFPVKAINAVSTIGAGDNFSAGVIYAMNQLNINLTQLNQISEKQAEFIVEMGAQFAAEVCLSQYNYISTDFAMKIKALQMT